MWSEHHQFLVGPANDGHYSYVTFVCAVQVISYLTDCVAVNSPELCAVCPFHGNRHSNCVYGYVYVYMREMRPQIGGNHGDLLSCIPCDTRLPPTIDVTLCWWLQYCPKHLSLDANVAVLVDRQQQRQICTLNLHTPQLEICTSKTETSAESVLSSANAQTKSITNYQIQMSCDIGHLNGIYAVPFAPICLRPTARDKKETFLWNFRIHQMLCLSGRRPGPNPSLPLCLYLQRLHLFCPMHTWKSANSICSAMFVPINEKRSRQKWQCGKRIDRIFSLSTNKTRSAIAFSVHNNKMHFRKQPARLSASHSHTPLRASV